MVVRSLCSALISVTALASCLGVAEARPHTKTVGVDGQTVARIGHPLASARRASISSLRGGIWLWRETQTPSPGPARVYGTTTSGCLAGAVALPARGEGFVRRRPWRRTGYGHPALVDYVERLGVTSRHAGLGALVIGDMSLPRGGIYVRGHASHQTGLDVDIAYKTLAAPIEVAADEDKRVPLPAAALAPRGAKRLEALLRLAAADEHVDRIFVAAGIKQRLCRTAVGDRTFLDVLRPWLGHEEHFHVRLKCPEDSPDCRPNEPVTAIPDGCEELSRWRPGVNMQAAFAAWRTNERMSYARNLPDACGGLVAPTRRRAMAKATPVERREATASDRRPPGY
jgi:penicillin-insensitive murein endopeptidase